MLDIKNIKLRTEEDIISSWDDKEKIVVSVCCTTFNHEDYIGIALDGFLMQETEFPIEIIVRDDCSTDSTATIIKSYVEKYPNIINPIYESENQFSQGIKPMSVVLKQAKGEFYALCEGDDYWTDSLKLQKQVGAFKTNPGISICFHSAFETDLLNETSGLICQHFQQDQIVPVADVIMGRGGYMPTASIIFKRQPMTYFFSLIESAPIGDYFLQMYLASLGLTYFQKEPMCVYRRNSKNSWTNKHITSTQINTYSRKMVISLDRFSSILIDKKHKKALYEVIKFYLITAIATTVGLRNKLKAIHESFADVKYYNRFHHKLGLLTALLKRQLGRGGT